jgi:hypothetical protein
VTIRIAGGTTSVGESHTIEFLIEQLVKIKASVTGFWYYLKRNSHTPSEDGNLTTTDHALAFAASLQSLFLKQMTGTQYQNFIKRINVTTLGWYKAFLRLPKTTTGKNRKLLD